MRPKVHIGVAQEREDRVIERRRRDLDLPSRRRVAVFRDDAIQQLGNRCRRPERAVAADVPVIEEQHERARRYLDSGLRNRRRRRRLHRRRSCRCDGPDDPEVFNLLRLRVFQHLDVFGLEIGDGRAAFREVRIHRDEVGACAKTRKRILLARSHEGHEKRAARGDGLDGQGIILKP